MLTPRQIRFRDKFLSPWRQRFYYLKSLPMGLFSGIKIIQLDETVSISEVPMRWGNKNPFNSMYFAVQSMAAELSTAAPVIMALKGDDADIALIIVDLKADFAKKAQSKVTFSCVDFDKITNAVARLKHAGDIATVTVRATGRDVEEKEVASFYFTWSFKRRS